MHKEIQNGQIIPDAIKRLEKPHIRKQRRMITKCIILINCKMDEYLYLDTCTIDTTRIMKIGTISIKYLQCFFYILLRNKFIKFPCKSKGKDYLQQS